MTDVLITSSLQLTTSSK